jgi:pyruvate formate lyase activating enzyme
MNKDDIEEIAKTVKECNLYAIQQFEPKDAYDDKFKKIQPPKPKELIELGNIAKKYVNNVVVRTFEGEIKI